MILADKIINERKRNGWSQEELAEKLGVSRQSVSKWEGAQAIPDLQKILKLAELFNVSTDYLLKDEIEGEPVPDRGYEPDENYNVRRVTLEEANVYLESVKHTAPKIAVGTSLCVVSPVMLIFLLGLTEIGFLAEGAAVAIGLLALFSCVGAAVFFFVYYGMQIDKNNKLVTGPFETAYGVEGMVKERMAKSEETSTKLIVIGVLMCVFCPVPLVVNAVIGASETLILSMVCLLLIIVAVAVFIFVLVGSVMDSYKILLKEKKCESSDKEEEDEASKVFGAFAGAYWLITTAIFLGLGFLANAWDRCWVIWPIAGVLFGAIAPIMKIRLKEKYKEN